MFSFLTALAVTLAAPQFAADLAVNEAGQPIDQNGEPENIAYVTFKAQRGSDRPFEVRVPYTGAEPRVAASTLFADKPAGTYEVWATAGDAANNNSAPSPRITFVWNPVVDTVPPAAPTRVRIVNE